MPVSNGQNKMTYRMNISSQTFFSMWCNVRSILEDCSSVCYVCYFLKTCWHFSWINQERRITYSSEVIKGLLLRMLYIRYIGRSYRPIYLIYNILNKSHYMIIIDKYIVLIWIFLESVSIEKSLIDRFSMEIYYTFRTCCSVI